ncbi:MAG TPA: AAA family ATPase, partial [Terriglobales bacterium]|nr:AAA family ATPase [Terriglobales bacterium]
GVGKSTLMLDVAARLSVGGQMPYGSSNCDAGPVLLLTAEDGLGDTVRPRLEAAGADLSKIEAINAETLPSFPESIDAVRATITRTGAKLVIIDPLSDFFSRNLNPYVDQHCRAALTPLARVAEETRAATVIVRHVRKGGDGPAIHRGGGSIGMIAVARVGLVVVQDPDDEERRVLAVAKCNLGQRATSLVFHLQSVTDHTARIEWEGPSPHSADALVAASRRSQQSGDDVERVAMLREFLSDGPKWWDDIRSLYPDAGYAVADRTIRRDGKKLHVIVERIGFQGQVMWSLPRDAALIQTEPNLGGGRASSWFE